MHQILFIEDCKFNSGSLRTANTALTWPYSPLHFAIREVRFSIYNLDLVSLILIFFYFQGVFTLEI